MIRIDEIFISSFGKLKDFSLSLNGGFNGICEANGYGKTTIANFVKAMFFGFSKTRAGKLADNERKKYTPWESNQKFGGYIRFCYNDKIYKIERFFGKTAASDTFALFDEYNVPCNDFDENVGWDIFEIDADSFERCLYLPQKEVVVDANDSFLSKLNKIVDNTDDFNNYESATTKLQDIQRQLVSTSRTKNVSKKTQILDEIAKTQDKLYTAQQSYIMADEKQKIIDQNNQSIERAQAGLRELKEKQRASDSKKALQSKAEIFLRVENNYNQAKNRVDALIEKNADVSDDYIMQISQKIDELEVAKQQVAKLGEEQKAIQKPKQSKVPYVLCGIVAVLILIATAFFANSMIANPVLFALPVVALLGVAFLAIKSKLKFRAKTKQLDDFNDEQKQKVQEQIAFAEQKQNELVNLFANHKIFEPNFHVALSQLKNNKAVYEEAILNYRYATNEWNAKMADPEFALAMNSSSIQTVDYTDEIKRMDEYVLELSKQNASLQKEVEMLLGNANLASDLKNRTERLKQALDEVEKQAKLAEIALGCLEQAKTNLSQSFMPVIAENFNKYIGIITNGQYQQASLDDKFNLRLCEKNSYREFDFFSKGIIDISVFCLRLALIDTMYGDNLPFLILDDPFVNYDDEKMKTALQLIGERSKKCQIIYFTCHGA